MIIVKAVLLDISCSAGVEVAQIKHEETVVIGIDLTEKSTTAPRAYFSTIGAVLNGTYLPPIKWSVFPILSPHIPACWRSSERYGVQFSFNAALTAPTPPPFWQCAQ